MVGNGVLVNEQRFKDRSNTISKSHKNTYHPVTQLTLLHQCSINIDSHSCKYAMHMKELAE
jgi:hypothetical protein